MKKYKADLKKDINAALVSAALLAVGILLSSRFSRTGWIAVLFSLAVILIVTIFSYRLFEIQLDVLNNRLTLIYRNYLKATKIKTINFQDIEFTYKKQAVAFKGAIKNVCSIYNADKRIDRLIPDNDGWDDDEISRFVHDMIDMGVRKKFIGYSLKDVDI